MIMDEGQTLPNVVLATGGAVPLSNAPPITTYAVPAHIAPRRDKHDKAGNAEGQDGFALPDGVF